MKTATPRIAHSAWNKAWSALVRAERAWGQFASAIEVLAELHDDQNALPAVRDLAREMHAFWEVLQVWSTE